MHRRFLTVLVGLLLTAAPLCAQDKPEVDAPATLTALLRAIEALPLDAWNARVRELESDIAAHTEAAAKLRKQAEALQAEAAQKDAAAKAVQQEIERLRALMALVVPKSATKTAPKGAPKAMPAAAPAQAEKKDTPKKPVDAKPKTESKAAAIRLVSYAEHVFPIFDEHCTICHDDADTSGGLDLSTYAKALEGGGSGATIVPGQPDSSRLFRLVTQQEKPYMPRDGDQLDAESLATIRDWIALGAPADADAAKAAAKKLTAKAAREAAAAAAPKPEIAPTMPTQLPAVPLAEIERAPALKTLAASPHAPLLAVAGHRQVLLLQSESLQLLGVLPFRLGQVEVLEFTRDGTRLLAAGGEPGARGGAILFDVATGAEVQAFGPERDTVLAAAISPGQSVVALGGPSRKVRAYSTADGSRLYEISAHNDWILSAAISPDGNWLATADRAGIVEVHEADTGRPVHTINPRGGAVHAVAFRSDAKLLAVATDSGKVSAWELEDGKRQWEARHGRGALALSWSSDHRLATSGDDGRVRVWESNGKGSDKSDPLGDWVYAVAFDSDGHVFAGDWAGRLSSFGTKIVKPTKTVTPALGEPSS